MATLHINEADLARDPYAVLAKVEEGMEVIVERNHRDLVFWGSGGQPGKRLPNPLR